MTINTRFGTFEATDDSSVIDMAVPLAGFERCRRYLLLSLPELQPFACLHGLDEPNPSFLALDPRFVDASYPCQLDSADYARLQANRDEPLLWLGIVSVGMSGATINLRAPVAINPTRMVGVQTIPPDSPYPIDHPLPVR
jgi:flagellar assembly factor FliW